MLTRFYNCDIFNNWHKFARFQTEFHKNNKTSENIAAFEIYLKQPEYETYGELSA